MSTLVSVVPRHPETLRDASGKLIGKGPVDVEPRDPFWRRLIRWGDVEVQKPATTSATTPAVATASASQNGGKP